MSRIDIQPVRGRLWLLLVIVLWPASGAFSICNIGPSAVADSVRGKAGELLFIDVLANDHHPQGLPLALDSPPSGSCSGTVSRDASLQLISYLASAGATGSCSFDYVVRDSAGGTDTATVTVNFVKAGDESPIVGPTLPALASAAEGVGLTLSASVSPQGMATYQWYYSASGEPEDFTPIPATDSRYVGAQSGVLNILSASQDEGGWYQLEVIDSAVLYPGYSEPARLEVHPALLVTSSSPAVQTVPEHAVVSWSVDATGGVPSPAIVWQFCPEVMPCETGLGYSDIAQFSSGHAGQRSGNLQILSADVDDQGWYRAVVRDGGVPEAAEIFSAAFHLRVVEGAGPGISGPKPAHAAVADNCLVTFAVKVVGTQSPPTFQWESRLPLSAFAPVADGGGFSGATTTRLSIDTSTVDETLGKRSYRLRVEVGGQFFYSGIASLSVKEGQLPFKAAGPIPIPTDIVGNTVAIEMEDFDLGGSGKGYIEKSAGNSGGNSYRGTEPVDLADCIGNGEICVVDIEPEEALSYTLSIEDEGFYELSYRYESPVENQSVIASFSDRMLSEVMTADTTQEGSGVMKTDGVYLERPPWTCGGKPTRILTVDFGGGGFKMNRLRFTKQSAPLQRPFAGVGIPANLPGILQAEEFDVVDGALGQTVAYKDLDSGNSSAAACGRDTDDPEWVECGVISDESSVARQGVELEEDEWLEYSVAVNQTGWYAATFDYIERTTSSPSVRLYLDDSLIQTVLLPPTNGEWLSYRAPVMRLQQTAGSVLRLEVDGAPMDLDRVDFDQIPNTAPTAAFDVTCFATTCTFTSTSTDDHGIVSHAWEVDGQPLPQTGSVVGHTFQTGGTKVVTLTVTDGDFASDTSVREIEINASPVASFTSACDGLLCSFDASASADDSSLNYQWTFFDAAGATPVSTVTPVVSYQYSAKGPYRVDLVVSDGELSDSMTDSNTEPDDYPAAAISVECDGFVCQFDASGSSDDGALVGYLWDFGDGSAAVETSTPSNVEHTYAANDVYTVSLTVTDNAPSGAARGVFLPSGPQTALATRTIEVQGVSETVRKILPILFDSGKRVNKPPSAHLEVSCEGLTCTLDASRSRDDRRIVGYLWDFGDGSGQTSTTTSVLEHTYAVEGAFDASVVVSDGRYEAMAVATAMPNQRPIAAFTWQCTALSCTFDAADSSADAMSYAWQFGDGTSQASTASATATHVYTASGDYTVTLTVADEVQSAVTSQTVIADAPPVAAFVVSCSSLVCSFDASGSSDDRGIASYAWSFGDGSTVTLSTSLVEYFYAQGGPYTVSLVVTDDAPQSSQTARSFTLDGPPVAAFSVDCTGFSCSFDASASSDDLGIQSYAWDFGDGETATTTVPVIDHVYAEGLSYSVTLTVHDGAQSDQASLTVEVDEPPVSAFTVNCRALRCTFDASGSEDDQDIVTYDWDFGDGAVVEDAVEPVIEYAYDTAGAYLVTLSVTDSGGQTESASETVRPRRRHSGMRPWFSVLPFLMEISASTSTEGLRAECAGLACTFSLTKGTAKGDDLTLLWSLGDGALAVTEEMSIEHTFLLAGEYQVGVTVLKDGIRARQIHREVVVDAVKANSSQPGELP